MPSVFADHAPRFIALTIGICALGSLITTALAQRGLAHRRSKSRANWLLFAAVTAGLTIWATHFTALLGYRHDLDLRFNLPLLASAFIVTVGSPMAAVFPIVQGNRGALAGMIVGTAMFVGHVFELQSLQFAGAIEFASLQGFFAVTAAIALTALAGHLLVRYEDMPFAWPSAVAFALASLTLYFGAMQGVTFVDIQTVPHSTWWTASVDELASLVVAVFLLLLVAAIVDVWMREVASRNRDQEQQLLIATLQKLRETEDHHRSVVELSPQIAWVSDPSGNITEIAPLWSELSGRPIEEALGNGWADVVHPDDLPKVLTLWRRATEAGDVTGADVRYRIRLKDGGYRWFRATARPRRGADGKVISWYGSLVDIDDQVAAEQGIRAAEERYRLASRAANDVIWDFSFFTRRCNWAGAHQTLYGDPELEHETDCTWWEDRLHPDDRERVLAALAQALADGVDSWQTEYRTRRADGTWVDVRQSSLIVRTQDGVPARMVSALQDISEQKRAEAELNAAAYHDPLTGLPNRALYQQRITEALKKAKGSVGVAVLDLNDFKNVNETLGHAAGDRVLTAVAKRLSQGTPESATVARLGGDEFAIIFPKLDDVDTFYSDLNRLFNAVEASVEFGGMQLPVSCSIGSAIWPDDATDPEDLLIAADLALYAAKSGLHGSIVAFSPHMRTAAEIRTAMLQRARLALNEDRIMPVYQPKVDLQTGTLIGWEALLRVRGARGELLPPSSIAEAFLDGDLSVQLTDRMLDAVFADLQRWQESGLAAGSVAVNLSPADFRRPGLAAHLKALSQATGVPLGTLEMEITESVLIGQMGIGTARLLDQFRSLGILVALDDFGTGYASLTHVLEFPVDILKIDKTFVDHIPAPETRAGAVVEAVLQMANRMGIASVAEGIETLPQAQFLKAHGCTYGQGHLFGRPVTGENVPLFLHEHDSDRWRDLLARDFGADAPTA